MLGLRPGSRDGQEHENGGALQGFLGQALPQLRQLFDRFPAASAAADADARFEQFRAHVWPQIKESSATGALQHLLLELGSFLSNVLLL